VGRRRLRRARARAVRVMAALPRGLRALAYALLGASYIGLAFVHAVLVNTNPGRHDQSTYLWGARTLHESHFAAPTNRSQMPAFLYVQALFYPDGAREADAFGRAKVVSIALSAVLLLALGVFFARSLPKREGRIAMLATAFTVFVFRAAYVQAELLFYTVAFFGFAALCRLWERPSLRAAAVAGLLEALAFLSKGSVQPGIALFVVLYLARSGWEARAHGPGRLRELGQRLAELAVLLATFLAPLAPYLAKSKEMYGSYFFNMNTRYVMWCDSWDAFLAREAAIGKWWSWGALPEGELPSLGHYLREHTFAAMARREVRGVGEVLGNLVIGTGYFEFIALYLAFAAVAFGFTRSPRRAIGAVEPRSPVAFALPYVLVYLAVFGFYAPIAAGARFSLMLWLPVLYTTLRAGVRAQPTALFGARRITWAELNAFVLLLLVLHVLFVVPTTIGRIYAGG
jgi:hypothetical protein